MSYYGVHRHKPMSEIIAKSAEKEDGKAPTPAQPEAADDTLPEKYRGKTAQEIAEMHMNSEKRLGQIQNEVGQLRGLVQDLAQVQRTPSTPTPEAEVPVDVSGDDLISHPAETIRKVVQPLLAKSETKQQDPTDTALLAMEQNALMSDFGDVQQIAATEEFQQFCQRTSGRQKDFQRACDASLGIEQVRAARRLLEDYTDFKSSLPSTEAEKVESSIEAAKKVATEGAGQSGPVSVKNPIYEADVIEMINREPEKYRSPAFQAELHAAIRDGRYIKNG